MPGVQFARRLRHLWSWLPAFRAVAETEHLPTAAAELGIVPSALSRTVKLLEDELGVALFDRSGKTLVLNDAGRTLVDAVREAMRLIDDALGSATRDELRGSVTAVACGDLAGVVLAPACARVATDAPQLTVNAQIVRQDDIASWLARGDADVGVTTVSIERNDLCIECVTTWRRAVYVRRGGTACGRSVVVGVPSDTPDDGWPLEYERTIAAWVPDQSAALEIVATSDLATVAYERIAESHAYGGRIERLPSIDVASRSVFVLTRRPVGCHPRTELLLGAIRGVLSL